MSDCRGCDGTCCTGVGSEACSCEPREVKTEVDPAAQALLKALSGPVGGIYLAYCPAHDDENPSLSFKRGKSWVFINCHSGCTTAKVLAALDMDVADLLDKNTD